MAVTKAGLTAALAVAALAAAVPASATPPDFCTPWQQKTLKSGLGTLENLEFDGKGGMLLSSTANNAIERLAPNGNVTTLIPNVSAPGGQRVIGRTLYFNTGDAAQSGLANTPDGTLQRFNLDTRARGTVATGLTMPNGLATLPNGDFVVSRDIGTGTGITRIPRNDPAHPQTSWAKLDDQNGLAVDPTGTWLYADQTFTLDSAVYRIRISNPSDMNAVATLYDSGIPKGLDDMAIDSRGILYIAANAAGQVIRLDPATGKHCTIVSGLQNPSSLKFGRGPGWDPTHLYATGFDGSVRELVGPASALKKHDRLALSVQPKSTEVGNRTHFRFIVYRVHNGRRARLRGARVTLGGKAATTGKRGRASLTLAFRHTGRRVARATKRGYVSATRSVRVHG